MAAKRYVARSPMPDFPETPTGPIVGIDLGTTNSLVGAMDAGFPVLIADADGHRLTPSVVYFPAEGMPLVGQAAVTERARQAGTDDLFREAAHGYTRG